MLQHLFFLNIDINETLWIWKINIFLKNNLVTPHCGRSGPCPSRGEAALYNSPVTTGVMEGPGVREASRGDHQIFINLWKGCNIVTWGQTGTADSTWHIRDSRHGVFTWPHTCGYKLMGQTDCRLLTWWVVCQIQTDSRSTFIPIRSWWHWQGKDMS